MRLLLPLLILTGCAEAAPRTDASDRIVSIDYCADQMVLGLVARSRIAAVSHEATADPLFAGRIAGTLPRVRPDAEAILALNPTLVVRSYAGGARLDGILARAGVRVFTLPYASSVGEVRQGLIASGAALQAEPAAQIRLRQFDRDVAGTAADTALTHETALYTTPGDYTAGPGTLIDEMIGRSALTNADQRPGWHRLDAEQLLMQPPTLVIRGFGESRAHQTDAWSGSDHQALRGAFAHSKAVAIPGSWLACGNWRIGHAIARLRSAAESVGAAND